MARVTREQKAIADQLLAQKGYTSGAAVEAVIVRCYGTWLGSQEIARAQLTSLKAAWQAELEGAPQ